jgi:hypothetical protein
MEGAKNMDREELNRDCDRKRGMRYSTLIFVPHMSAKYRKLKISHRLIFTIFFISASSLGLSGFFTFRYFTSGLRESLVQGASTAALEQELADASMQMLRAHKNLQVLTQHLVQEQLQRERQLSEMQKRYDALRGVTQGQEKIAEAYRTILERRSLSDKLTKIGLGFSVGVLSSVVAATLLAWLKSKPLTDVEAEKLNRD